MTNPPPPEVGDVLEGPLPGRVGRPLYYVRAVVDAEPNADYGWLYHVVLRHWSPTKGWRYVVESAWAFGFGSYKRVNKNRRPHVGQGVQAAEARAGGPGSVA